MKRSEVRILLWIYLGIIIGLCVLWVATWFATKVEHGQGTLAVSLRSRPRRGTRKEGRMMQLARRASLPMALYLLTSAATAPAQNAWVLWRRFIPPTILRTTTRGCGRPATLRPSSMARLGRAWATASMSCLWTRPHPWL
jgi:hypothetical protein